jgi:hypothetical protein
MSGHTTPKTVPADVSRRKWGPLESWELTETRTNLDLIVQLSFYAWWGFRANPRPQNFIPETPPS